MSNRFICKISSLSFFVSMGEKHHQKMKKKDSCVFLFTHSIILFYSIILLFCSSNNCHKFGYLPCFGPESIESNRWRIRFAFGIRQISAFKNFVKFSKIPFFLCLGNQLRSDFVCFVSNRPNEGKRFTSLQQKFLIVPTKKTKKREKILK